MGKRTKSGKLSLVFASLSCSLIQLGTDYDSFGPRAASKYKKKAHI